MAPKIGWRGPKTTSRIHGEDRDVLEDQAPQLERVNWMRDPGLRRLYAWAFVLWIASWTTGYDGSMLNNMRIIPKWEDYFDSPTGGLLGILTALYQIGSLASLPIIPFFADHFGRKFSIAVGCVIMIIGGVIQGAAQNLGMFMGGRFLVGFGNSLAQLCSPLLLTELCHPQHRGRVTAVYNCLWNLGYIINTWLTFGTQHINGHASWRIPAFVQCAPAVVQVIFIFWCPESPRWLIAKDRDDKALHILAKYHANGNAEHPTVQFEYREIKETLAMEFQSKKTSSYLDFLRTSGNRYRLMLICSVGLFSQWSGNTLVSYFSTEIYDSIGLTDPTSKLGINGGLAIMSLFVSVLCAILVDRVGRRPLFLSATGGMCFAFTIWTICAAQYEQKRDTAAGKAVIAFIWIHSFSYALAWSGLLIAYSVEVLPFKIRAKGLMIMNLSVQVALTVNQQLNPIALDNLPHSYDLFIIYNVWVFLELCFVYFFYVETKGPTLEELAKIIDGDEAEVAHVNVKDTAEPVYHEKAPETKTSAL
ncbi:hexose transporter protein [Lineolata rhizophorae]|uniref:Hexose transporter protein n=1 Tax=Lineolata rhizophorae TaxID=578093 RepID=A0A6A6NSQ1_9PEZI|nr:hexose transporter protein [Lineolata rhizophorae]